MVLKEVTGLSAFIIHVYIILTNFRGEFLKERLDSFAFFFNALLNN